MSKDRQIQSIKHPLHELEHLFQNRTCHSLHQPDHSRDPAHALTLGTVTLPRRETLTTGRTGAKKTPLASTYRQGTFSH